MNLEICLLLFNMNKSDILLTSINNFYTIPENRATLIELLNKSGGISLRNLEWFITNYSKNITSHMKRMMGEFSVYIVLINQV